MKLLYLQQLLVLPGLPGNDRCWQFAKQWAELGHEITFLSSDALLPDGHPWKAPRGGHHVIEQGGIKVILLSVAYSHQMPFWRRSIQFLRFYTKAFRKGRQLPTPDAVLAYTAPLSVGELGRKLAAFHQVPFFYEVADVWPDVPIEMGVVPFKPLQKWLYSRTNRIYEEARHIFPFSKGMTEQIKSHGVSPEKITTIPNGADYYGPAPIRTRSVQQSRQTRQVRIAPEKINVIYTGTIGKANDLGQLIAAWAVVRSRAKTAFLNIIGEGNDLKRVKKLAERMQLDGIAFHPVVSREKAQQLLGQADIGIISFAAYPILETNAATKFFDYLAAGLPMVINYEGWQAELMNRFEGGGLSAPQGDIEAFADQILKLIVDRELRKKLGQEGKSLAYTFFNRKKLGPKMMEIMEKRLAGRSLTGIRVRDIP